jgi:uncharacterized protein YkwD
MNRRFLVAGAAALTLLAAPAGAQAACSNEDAPVTSISGAEAEAALFCLVNEARAEAGKTALARKSKLADLARGQAAYSVDFGALTHTDAQGRNPGERASDAGYNWKAIGEDLALASTPAEAVQAWLGHEPHRRILLKAKFRDGGIGMALNDDLGNAVFGLLVGVRR